MIQAKHITVSVGSKHLLEDVGFTFEPGKINLIVGPNGAGKSTLIKVLSGQTKPDSGQVIIDSKDLQSIGYRKLATIRAVLSQQVEIPFPLKAWEVVMMGRYPHVVGKPGIKDELAVQESMRIFEVEDLADRNFLTLSGGERQRVNFARVLTQIWYSSGTTRYLLLDEPLTFLDIHYQFEFMNRLRHLLRQPDLLVVGVVHDLNLAARFGDQIVLLHQGHLLAAGSMEDVLTPSNIKKAFQMEPSVHRINGTMYLVFP